MKTTALLSITALLSCTLGCEVPELEVPDKPAAPAKQLADQAEPEESADEIPDSEPPVTSSPRPVTANDPAKGKKSRAAGGYLGAVAHSRFYAEHQIIFMNVTKAIQLDWAMNGEYPRSHDEFMERIIKFNKIKLPELEEGVQYLYDPEDHMLKIHRPEN
jgi:hypothetical protein